MSNENTKHTPGPWFHYGTAVCAERPHHTHLVVAETKIHGTGSMAPDEWLANARRIVACVNACEGIPTEALVPGGVKAGYEGAYREKQELQQQRDELLLRLSKVETLLDVAARILSRVVVFKDYEDVVSAKSVTAQTAEYRASLPRAAIAKVKG